jgi:hypothetical protein
MGVEGERKPSSEGEGVSKKCCAMSGEFALVEKS